MKRASAAGAALRQWWPLVLAGLWFVACLNPMPDDFPNQDGTATIDGAFDSPPSEPEVSAPGVSNPDDGQLVTDDPGQGSGGSGAAGAPAGNAGASGAADAGPPEADAGP